MNTDACILYYSSGREYPDFERRVQQVIMANCGEMPIVCVSQFPLPVEFANRPGDQKICVGDVGTSGFNMFRQVQIGLQVIKQKFVISAEADCLYPPDYFQCREPALDICYRDSNLYVMGDYREYYFRKPEGATHAQIVGRDYYLRTLDNLFRGAPEWSTEEKNFPKERCHKEDVFQRIIHYHTENPVVQIKTHRGMRYYTHSEREPIYTIPYWGEGRAFRRYFLKGEGNAIK